MRYGLMGIKNVGEQAMEFVLSERAENGAFKDIRDFLDRCAGQVNKRMVESLIKGGALDCFGKSRATLMASYERILDTVLSDKKSKISGQLSLFDELIEDEEIKYNETPEYAKADILKYEKEVLGMYLSGHPLDDYSDTRHEFDFDTSMLFVEQADEEGNVETVVDQSLAGKTVKFGCVVSSFEKKATAKQQKFAVGRVEDRMGSISFSMYPRAYEKYGELLSAECPLKIVGKIDLRDESEAKISIEKVEVWQQDGAANTPSQAQSQQGERRVNGILYVLLKNVVEKDMVSDILALHPGSTPCQAQVKRDGQSKLLEFAQKVDVCEDLLARLQDVLGASRVKYVIKK